MDIQMLKNETYIMIVDDNDFMRKTIATALSGYQYVLAKNGKDAIQKFLQKRPGMVFLDIEMPDVNGITLLKQLKKIAPELYAVMLTAHSDRHTVMESLNSGARGFIGKPFSKAKLEDYIEKYCAEMAFDLVVEDDDDELDLW